ncbi:MAG: hypothetical protein ACYDEY_06910 [Acidimicrobiales bacterium]
MSDVHGQGGVRRRLIAPLAAASVVVHRADRIWRSTSLLLVLTGVLMAGGILASCSSGVKSSTSTLSRLPKLASPIASPHGNPGSAANIAAQASLHVSSVVSDAQRTFGSRYAGAWIDNSGKSPVTRIMVAGSANASTDRLFRGRLALSVARKTEVSYVKYSMAQLNAYKKTIVDYLANHFKTPAYRPSGEMILYIDTKDNSVGIGLTHQDVRFLAQLQKLIPSNALRVQWISPAPRPR